MQLAKEEQQHLFSLLNDISTLAKKQTESQMSLAETLIASAKSASKVVKFHTLEEANVFLDEYRIKNNEFLMSLTDLISNSYLDDLIGQKVNRIKRNLLNMDECLSYSLDTVSDIQDTGDTVSDIQIESKETQEYINSLGI
jgi:hypothetical protein